jgi:F0F1-type ATP synthase assembly protein I
MAFPPNYNQQRNDRLRAKQEKKERKERAQEEKAEQRRKEQQALTPATAESTDLKD